MTMREYEERFRSLTPSLHQTFVATQGADQARRRSRRFWVALALVGVMTMTYKVALHHIQIETNNASQIWQPGIR